MGGSDGDATVTAFGGTPNFTYNWSDGQATAQATGLAAGTYTVTVTGSDSCAALISTTITEPGTAVTIDSLSVTDVSCNGAADGTGSVYASGGTGNLTYSWSDGQSSNNATGLSGGGYNITVTDANGCTASDSIVVIEAGAFSTSVASTNISCNGANDGSIDLTVTGGTAPYTFLWSTGTTTEDVSGLAFAPSTAPYMVTITDANGCASINGSDIQEPLVLSVSTGSITDPTSIGGTDGAVDMTVAGGTAPYTYLWNTGATTEDLTNIGAGSYTLAVTDANGCAGTAVAVVNDGPDGVTENLVNVDFTVYPNPSDGQFAIKVNTGPNTDLNIEVRNIIGQLVWKEDKISTPHFYRKVNIETRNGGLYFITLEGNGVFVTKKLVLY
jgi:hypothetical protein